MNRPHAPWGSRVGPYVAIIAGVVATSLVGCASEPIQRDRLTDFVVEVLFGGPFDANLPQNDTLARWTSPLYVEFADDRAAAHRPQVEDLLARFTRLSGIPADVVSSGAAANVTVSFTPNETFVVNRERVPCFAKIRAEAGELTQATVKIGVGDDPAIRRCLAHELYHVFGLRYHSARVRSILSPVHGETSPTRWDDLGLQVLYDPKVKPGMSKAQARPIFDAAIARSIETP